MSAPVPTGSSDVREALRIAHVIHALAPEAGGTSAVVPSLCEELGNLGHRVRVHATSHGAPPRHMPQHFALSLHANLPLTGRFGLSPGLRHALAREAQEADVVHSHGLWLGPNLDAHRMTRGRGARVVVSPHGMLEPYALARQKWAKRAIWHLGQGEALREAHCLHVTAESELASVRALGLRNPVAVVPVGVSIPKQVAHFTGARRRLLFLGRVDHKKGVDLLLRAWSRVADQQPAWDLWIVGPSTGSYAEEMRRLSEALRAPRVYFAGAAFDEARDEHMANADLFVLPTRSENFGMTVAEALAIGLPVVCTKGAPWARLSDERCGYWVDIDATALAGCLSAALTQPRERLRAMGARGRLWMEREYSWRAQAVKLAEAYRWLLGREPRPAHVNVV